MDIKEIKQLIDVMCSSTLTNLEIEQDGTRIKLERTPQGQIVTYANNPEFVRDIGVVAPVGTTAVPSVAQETIFEAPVSNKVSKEVKAPMVGTFHILTSKKIEAGSKLRSGDVLCIVEAMKLMNEISITEAGEIVTVEVNEGDMVEFGQVLFTYN